MDSFDGSVSAVDGSGFGNTGNSNGSGDMGGGGYATSAADLGALAGTAATAFGPYGAIAGTIAISAIAQLTGVNPFSAMIDLAHDMSLSLGTNLAVNPSQLAGLFVADSNPVGTPGIDPAAGSLSAQYWNISSGGGG